jgi:type IV secretory pathway ATPase VirB11/archaellum biosynthesis ATPase
LAFFSKTNVMIKILHNLPLFWVKNANFFAEFFGENILIIITSVPGRVAVYIILQPESFKFSVWYFY